MADDDLIRRGDALEVIYNQHPEWTAEAINALPAVTPAPTLAEALDVLPQEGERANVQRVEHCWPEKCWIVRWGPFASEKQAEAMLRALRRIAEGVKK